MVKNLIICVDSDGCVFDSMEMKHKECFAPAFIEQFSLDRIEETAKDVWARVNLYSQTRGCNRFIALRLALRKLREEGNLPHSDLYDEVIAALDTWLGDEEHPSNSALENSITQKPSPPLEKCLEWSHAVNERIARHPSAPPFENAKQALQAMREAADVVVVSQTPVHTLEEEWRKFQLEHLVIKINGQESGSKSVQIRKLIEQGANPEDILMVGDAPGDAKAAGDNGVWFFPIVPGNEEESWKRLHNEGLPRFFENGYGSVYQEALLEEFNKKLPS